MKRITSLLLTLTLWASFILSCSAQSLKMIPVHFHNLTKLSISHVQLDEQIGILNRIYNQEKTVVRFQLASSDGADVRLGGKSDLNVRLIPLPCDFAGCKYGASSFPWDLPFLPLSDKIDLEPSALPNGKVNLESFLLMRLAIGSVFITNRGREC